MLIVQKCCVTCDVQLAVDIQVCILFILLLEGLRSDKTWNINTGVGLGSRGGGLKPPSQKCGGAELCFYPLNLRMKTPYLFPLKEMSKIFCNLP